MRIVNETCMMDASPQQWLKPDDNLCLKYHIRGLFGRFLFSIFIHKQVNKDGNLLLCHNAPFEISNFHIVSICRIKHLNPAGFSLDG